MSPRLTGSGLALAGLAAFPAVAAADALTSGAGRWESIFAPAIEQTIGASVRVDRASIANTGTGRTFRQVRILLTAQGRYPRGTVIFSRRSVDCARSLTATMQWRVLGPDGAALGGSGQAGRVAPVVWNSIDGRVLHYVCTGAPSR